MGGLPWLKLDGDSPLHPKVARLEAALGIPDAFGIVARVWCWTSKYAPAGIVLPEDQPSFAKWVTSSLLLSADTVVECLVSSRVLDLHRNGLEVHGWEEIQAAHIDNAEGNRKRQKAFRRRNALRNAQTVTDRNATDKIREDKIREEKIREEKKDPAPAAPGAAVWDAYSAAYQKRYGAVPVRNQKVNTQLLQLVKRIAADEAPEVAKFYLGHNGAEYVRKMHSVGMLLIECEKIRTEWATGRKVTATAAKHGDEKQETIDGWNNLRRVSNGLE